MAVLPADVVVWDILRPAHHPSCMACLSATPFFGIRFNQPVVEVAWPASLQQLSFGDRFHQPIAGVMWPASLQQLLFGDDFNQPFAGDVWPTDLQRLSVGSDFTISPSSELCGRSLCSG